ncbi:MAG TPA: DUF222 domain-containing protein, partial [Desertimonas sp.]|nr:DUF222 domain-containing protein [Desertimonas sp.]
LDDVVELLAAELDQCTSDGLSSLVRRSLRVRGWLDSLDTRIAAVATWQASVGTSPDAATVLAGGGRRARRDAEAAAARSAVCARMPGVGMALSDGTVTAGHVDVLVKATRQLDDAGQQALADHAEALVEAATSLSPEQFDREIGDLARLLSADGGLSRHERLRRQRQVRRWVDRHSGMCNTLLSLDPLADARVWTAFNTAVATARAVNQHDDDRTWDQLQTDAIVDHLTRQPTDVAEGSAAAGAEVSVLIDLDALLHDSPGVAETADGQPLPVEVIRRLGCDGIVVPIWLTGDGEVLAVGRQRRLANRAQRRALRAMYRTCCIPDCTVGFEHCRIHHVTFWEGLGATDLDNLVPICERHHHLVHEGGWTLRMHSGRRIVLLQPDGTPSYDGITTNRRPTAPITCQRQRPPPPTAPTTATEIAEALQLALDVYGANAP